MDARADQVARVLRETGVVANLERIGDVRRFVTEVAQWLSDRESS